MPEVAWADLDALREASYRFYSSALLPPDPERVARWEDTAEIIDGADPEAFAFAPAWRRLRARVVPPPSELMAEYVRLFDAGVDGALCPPYESHWLASPRRGGPALVTSELEQTYRGVGLSVSRRGSVTADHVATELEVAAFLCRAQRAARGNGDAVAARTAQRRQMAFLDEHLGRWLPELATRLRTVAPESFYRAVVDAAAAFVRHDRDLLGALSAEAEPVGAP
jgi:TorA maturation chaperone TorD